MTTYTVVLFALSSVVLCFRRFVDRAFPAALHHKRQRLMAYSPGRPLSFSVLRYAQPLVELRHVGCRIRTTMGRYLPAPLVYAGERIRHYKLMSRLALNVISLFSDRVCEGYRWQGDGKRENGNLVNPKKRCPSRITLRSIRPGERVTLLTNHSPMAALAWKPRI